VPAVDVVIASPVGVADKPLVNSTTEEVFFVELDMVNDRVARTPFEIVLEFTPKTIHFRLPATLLHEIDLLAAVAAGPAVKLREEKSVVE
jgi:hypothetical protein